jgi:hypothetical protein
MEHTDQANKSGVRQEGKKKKEGKPSKYPKGTKNKEKYESKAKKRGAICKTEVHADYPSERATAFDILADKGKIQKSLYRTKLCFSVDNGGDCPHGKDCTFAHNIEELRRRQCQFQDECRFVRFINGTWQNVGHGKKCHWLHPEEEIESYNSRMGFGIAPHPPLTPPPHPPLTPPPHPPRDENVVCVSPDEAIRILEDILANRVSDVRMRIIY